MKPRRGVGLPDAAESAGLIASSIGKATVTPMPCRNVLRDSAFFVMYIEPSLSIRLCFSHLKRNAPDDARNQRRKRVIIRGRLTHDIPRRRGIIILQVPSYRIHQ